MKYFALLILTILLAIILLPIGFIMRLFYSGIGKHLYKVCQGIDQLGNVVCDKLFNATLIKSTGYQFGDEDEVISSVIGKNYEAGTLSVPGRLLNWLLNAIDKEHTKKAIEYPARTLLTILSLLILPFITQAQTANAGSDQTIYLTTTNQVILNGAASTGTGLTYLWTEVSSDYLSGATITSPTSSTTTVTGLPQGTFYFELTVRDNLDRTSSDTVVVRVDYDVAPGTLLRSMAAVYPDIKPKVNDRTDTLNTNTGEEIYPISFPDNGNEVFFDRNRSPDMFIDSQNGKFWSTVEDGYDWNDQGYGRAEMSFGDGYVFDTTKTYCMEWKGYFPQGFSTMTLNQSVAVFMQVHAFSGTNTAFGTQMINDGTGTKFVLDNHGALSTVCGLDSFVNKTHTVRVTFKEGTPGAFYKIEVDGVQRYFNNTDVIGASPRGQDYPKIATIYDYGNALADPTNSTRGRKFAMVTEDFSIYDVTTTAPPTISVSGSQTISVDNTTITASGTAAIGQTITYQWTKISGNGSITSPTSASTSVTGLSGTSVFQCTVTQSDGQTASGTVTINVIPAITNYFITHGKTIYINQ